MVVKWIFAIITGTDLVLEMHLLPLSLVFLMSQETIELRNSVQNHTAWNLTNEKIMCHFLHSVDKLII